jgi:AcrR family transcriptional regulator
MSSEIIYASKFMGLKTLALENSSSDRRNATKDALLSTAERLYAERGLDAVSMREITREAGQRNSTALQYHFSSKQALVFAIINRRMNDGDSRRLEFLHDLELRGKLDDVRSLVGAMVEPVAVGIKLPKRWPAEHWWVRFLSEVQRCPEFDLVELAKTASDLGLRRVYMLLGKQLRHVPDVVLRQRFLIAMSQALHGLAELDRLRERRRRSRQRFDVERAIENLIDMTAGALSAPVSIEVTRRLEP